MRAHFQQNHLNHIHVLAEENELAELRGRLLTRQLF